MTSSASTVLHGAQQAPRNFPAGSAAMRPASGEAPRDVANSAHATAVSVMTVAPTPLRVTTVTQVPANVPTAPRALQPSPMSNTSHDDMVMDEVTSGVSKVARSTNGRHVAYNSSDSDSEYAGDEDGVDSTSADSRSHRAAGSCEYDGAFAGIHLLADLAPAPGPGYAIDAHGSDELPAPASTLIRDASAGAYARIDSALPHRRAGATFLDARFGTTPVMFAPLDTHHEFQERALIVFSDRMWIDVSANISLAPGSSTSLVQVVCVLHYLANGSWQRCGGVLPLMQEASPSARSHVYIPPGGGPIAGTISLKGVQMEKSASTGERRRPVYCLQLVARLSDGSIVAGPRSPAFIRQCRPSYLSRVYMTLDSKDAILEDEIVRMLPNMRKKGRVASTDISSGLAYASLPRQASPATLGTSEYKPESRVDSAVRAVTAAAPASTALLAPVAAQLAAGAAARSTPTSVPHAPVVTAARPLLRVVTRTVPHRGSLVMATPGRTAQARMVAPSYAQLELVTGLQQARELEAGPQQLGLLGVTRDRMTVSMHATKDAAGIEETASV